MILVANFELFSRFAILQLSSAITMRIPHTLLSAEALQAVVEEFVSRDGTDQSSVERRIETVLSQLIAGKIELHFDDESKSCNILPACR